jgi:hypothetical protein
MAGALEPGPMQVIHDAFSTKDEVLDDIKALDFWPTTYVSDLMDELPVHWHDFDNCGYVLEGQSYVLDGHGDRISLGPGDKLVIPRGAIHAEGRSPSAWSTSSACRWRRTSSTY